MSRILRYTAYLVLYLTGACWAQTVRIQGKEVPCQTVDGKQVVRAADLGDSFPDFARTEGWVELEKLAASPNARVVRRNGEIVSVRYYDRAMQAIYGESKPTKESAGTEPNKSDSAASYRAIMDEIVRLSNIEREKNGAPPLEADPLLEKSATGHSQEMAELGYFSHNSPTPGRETPHQRINLAGASPRASAENIAWFGGYPESQLAERAVDGWMHSEGHRKNLLNPTYTHIGIGVGRNGDKYYLTQNFGAY